MSKQIGIGQDFPPHPSSVNEEPKAPSIRQVWRKNAQKNADPPPRILRGRRQRGADTGRHVLFDDFVETFIEPIVTLLHHFPLVLWICNVAECTIVSEVGHLHTGSRHQIKGSHERETRLVVATAHTYRVTRGRDLGSRKNALSGRNE